MICSYKLIVTFHLLILLWCSTLINSIEKPDVRYLNPGETILRQSSKANKLPFIFCYKARPKQISSIWETASMSIDQNEDTYEKFEGCSADDVMKNFKNHQSSWTPSILPFWKRKDIKLDPFNTTCIGILTSKTFEITVLVTNIDHWQFLKFLVGISLFFYAKKLSDNQLFYYICGISLGICGSVAILIYLFSRLLPNKPMMYGIAIGGWTMSLYFLQYLVENIKIIILDYYQYVFGYIGVSGIVSFAICYRLGPLSNPRSKKLIQWSLQITGLLLIFYSSYMYELTYPIDLILILSRVTPFSLFFSAMKFLKKKLFRPRVKLLTRKEYAEQGRKETKKALEQLRGYCSSPECNQWKTMLKLKNAVKFAEFMEGSFHVSEDEIEEYESLSIKPNGTIITDDSDNSVTEYTEED